MSQRKPPKKPDLPALSQDEARTLFGLYRWKIYTSADGSVSCEGIARSRVGEAVFARMEAYLSQMLNKVKIITEQEPDDAPPKLDIVGDCGAFVDHLRLLRVPFEEIKSLSDNGAMVSDWARKILDSLRASIKKGVDKIAPPIDDTTPIRNIWPVRQKPAETKTSEPAEVEPPKPFVKTKSGEAEVPTGKDWTALVPSPRKNRKSKKSSAHPTFDFDAGDQQSLDSRGR